ncbi:MAG: acyl-CoA dehydrogenase [Spirochaetes bacterium]|mgnify:FL=1|nr:acyl-CoA dehydrogenase [Spirochaetota bacterium]NMB63479.1 acyl-CoA dehydrogenase [Spirochaetota bacterium]HOJ28317.1 acyl-CoA dehydrogenase [Spirochaetota bacterium]HOM09538.1 acyl-CoA dehydrogenase [Spirochaetota bacterium]HPP49535.1 acyl-CoA dehydrogenase [Spirochaetota bacterium]
MDFNLSEEQQMVKDMCRKFAENELAPKAEHYDRTHEFPWEHVKKLGEMGMMGVVYPEEYGGSGMDYLTYAIAVEEISRGCASTGVIVSAHNSLCLSPIYYFGTEQQKKKYLPKLCSGEWIGCFGITEPNAGSDAAGTKTTAEFKNGKWVLNGTKNFITNGGVASVAVVMAVTEKGVGHKGLSMFIVEKGTPGFSVGKTEDKLGICASSTTELVFENCEIPEENLLGKKGDGFKIAMHTLDGGRVGIAAQALGIAQAAMDAAVKYSLERVQFNQPIARQQAIQWMIADMATEIQAARLLTYQAAMLIGSGPDRRRYSKNAAMAKLFASEASHRATHKALQIFGGYGYIKDYPAERFYRDSRITEIYEGTSEIQRLVIASNVLSEYQ